MSQAIPTRRRWLRFSLRALLAAITVLAVGLGWWANRAHRQRALVAAIKADGGRVEYDFYDYDFKGRPAKDAWIPEPLVRALGADFFRNVQSVWIYSADEALIRQCADLLKLKTIYLHNLTNFNEEMADRFARVRNLRGLALNESPISADSLRNIGKLSRLEWLYLDCPTLTDDALPPLRNLSRLKDLGLAGTKVIDAGLATVCELKSLEKLTLNGKGLSDDGLLQLKSLPKLKELSLGLPLGSNLPMLQSALPNCNIQAHEIVEP